MKKIGIITYHHYYNYGTMLQALALQNCIDKMGYGAEIIDFKQDNTLSPAKNLWIHIKRIPVYLRKYKKYKTLSSSKRNFELRNKKFEDFYKKHLVVGSLHYSTTEDLMKNPPCYDAYVVGSDQTWNPYVANAPQAFYLPFVDKKVQKGSYGPSLAISTLDEKQKRYFRERLENFEFLSCRESLGAKLLMEATGRSVTTVLDPTLLLNQEEWKFYFNEYVPKEKYILTYFLGEIKEHRDFVSRLSRKTGLKVISLPAAYLEIMDTEIEKVWGGPEEFLGLIKNADVICTDSFHGTMFSINFNKPFYTFCKTKDTNKESENSRIYSALKLFGLSDQVLKDPENKEAILPTIDYDTVNTILEKERMRCKNYLKDMLSTMTGE